MPTRHWIGRLLASFRNDREARLTGSISGPISDNAAFILSGLITGFEGNVENVASKGTDDTPYAVYVGQRRVVFGSELVSSNPNLDAELQGEGFRGYGDHPVLTKRSADTAT